MPTFGYSLATAGEDSSRLTDMHMTGMVGNILVIYFFTYDAQSMVGNTHGFIIHVKVTAPE